MGTSVRYLGSLDARKDGSLLNSQGVQGSFSVQWPDVCVRARVRVCACVCVCVRERERARVRVRVRVHGRVRVCECVCVRVYISVEHTS